MSETVSPMPGFMASVLSALNAQQASVPEAQRGLAPELKDLTARLAADPALENDPRFGVEVAWLVQDWQRFSGTGQAPALPPVLQAGLRVMAQDLPGLQNADLKALLAQAGAITDRNLVRDIRQQALRVAALSPAEQVAVGAAKAVAVLEYRVSQANAPAQASTQAAPTADPAPTSPVSPTVDPTASVVRPVNQTIPVAPSAPAQGGPTQRPDATASEPLSIRQPAPAANSAAADQSMRAEDKERAGAAETAKPAAPRQDSRDPTDKTPAEALRPRTGTVHQGGEGKTPPTNAFTPPTAEPNSGAQAIADLVAGGVGAALAPVTGVVQGLGRGISSHIANTRNQSDRRAIGERVDELREANRKVQANLDALREEGRPFFASFDKAVGQAGGNAQQVIADMAPGRPQEALHQELKDTLGKTPAFAEAWNQLKSSTKDLGRQAEYLRVEAHRRSFSQDPTVVESEQDAAKTGWKLTNLPGIEGGKNFVQEASKFVEMLVERMRDFLARVFGRGEDRNQSPSPSPGS